MSAMILDMMSTANNLSDGQQNVVTISSLLDSLEALKLALCKRRNIKRLMICHVIMLDEPHMALCPFRVKQAFVVKVCIMRKLMNNRMKATSFKEK